MDPSEEMASRSGRPKPGSAATARAEAKAKMRALSLPAPKAPPAKAKAKGAPKSSVVAHPKAVQKAFLKPAAASVSWFEIRVP